MMSLPSSELGEIAEIRDQSLGSIDRIAKSVEY